MCFGLPQVSLEEYKELTKAQFEKIKKSIGKEERDLVNNNEMEISRTDFIKYYYKVSDYNSNAGSLEL